MSRPTRRPCCRRELPRDAGHLYRKLAPNTRGNAVNRNESKTIRKHRELVEKPLYKCISEGLMHVSACIAVPQTKMHEIRGITFDCP